jgi:hypothetical protein
MLDSIRREKEDLSSWSLQSAEVENKQFIQDIDGKQRETTQQVQEMRLDISCIQDKQGDNTNRINEFVCS